MSLKSYQEENSFSLRHNLLHNYLKVFGNLPGVFFFTKMGDTFEEGVEFYWIMLKVTSASWMSMRT